MVEKCVVYGYSNSKNKQKRISLHKIPSDSDPRAEARRRRQRWIKFVSQKRKHWTSGKTSFICSVHFKHEDFTKPFNSNLKRALREDEFGVCVWPTIHVGKRASKNEHKGSPTKRQKRMASKLLIDLLLSSWISHVLYQIMSKIFSFIARQIGQAFTNNLRTLTILSTLYDLEWCPFLTSQQKKGVKYQTLLTGLFPTSPRESNLSSGGYSVQKITHFTNITHS